MSEKITGPESFHKAMEVKMKAELAKLAAKKEVTYKDVVICVYNDGNVGFQALTLGKSFTGATEAEALKKAKDKIDLMLANGEL